MNPSWFEAAKYVLPGAGLLFLTLLLVLRSPRHDFVRGVLLAGVFWLAVAGAGLYVKDTWSQARYLNGYEFFHYYMGSKYWSELGYSDLYESALVAQRELGQSDFPKTVRDLHTGASVSATQVLQQADAHKAKFSTARWEEFKGDVAFFRGQFGRGGSGWAKMMNDKGYNPPPMWTMVGSAFSNHVSTSSYWGMQALVMIDVVLMVLAAGFVLWAFGPQALFFLALVLFTQYVTSHLHMKAAFMRMDWIMFLVIAACLIKKEWWKTAGVLVAWAACSRVFPAVFAFGIGAKFLLDLLIDRRINWKYFAFLAAFGIALVVFAGASWLETGTAYWQDFLSKITRHNEDISAWRVGFKYVWLLSYRGGNLAQQYADSIFWFRAIQVSVLLVSIPLVRRLENYEAFCFGIVPVFFLVAPTYYYYIMILIPALFFAAKLDRWPWALGLALIFLEGMGAHYGHRIWDRSFPQFFSISCMVLVIVTYLAGVALIAKPQVPDREAVAVV